MFFYFFFISFINKDKDFTFGDSNPKSNDLKIVHLSRGLGEVIKCLRLLLRIIFQHTDKLNVLIKLTLRY